MGRGSRNQQQGALDARGLYAVPRGKERMLVAERPWLLAHRDDPRTLFARRIAVDLDDTVFPITTAINGLPGGEAMNMRDYVYWTKMRELCGGGEATGRLIDEAISMPYAMTIGPFAGAPEGLRHLARHGAVIDIITHRDTRRLSDTRAFLAAFAIPYEQLLCDLDIDKVSVCQQRNISLLIDDKPQTIAEAQAAGLRTLSLTWPYNERESLAAQGEALDNWHDLTERALDHMESLSRELLAADADDAGALLAAR